MWSIIENKEIIEMTNSEINQTFPSRLKVYNAKSDAILQKEQEYTHKLIDSYLKLTNPSDEYDSKEEFSNL